MRASLLLLLVPTAAAAAPFAGVDATLDGKPAHVAVDNGMLEVDGAIVAQLGSPASSVTVDARDVPARGPTIVVTLDGRDAIGFEKHGSWKQTFRVPIGPVGEDGDFGAAVALLPNGVHRYQTRPGLRRCDDKPALFFAEGWNGAKFVPLRSIATEVEPGGAISATPSAPPSVAPLLFRATIASREPGAGDIASLTVPRELDDGDIATTWSDANAGGQFVTFESHVGAAASELVVVAAAKGKPAPPSAIAIVGANNRVVHATLPPLAPGAAATIELPQPMPGCATVVIKSSGPAGFAELDVYGEGERAGGGEAMLAQVIASGADGAQAAERALAARGAVAVAALDDALAKATDPKPKARLIRALIANPDPSAGAALANAARSLRLRDDDLAAVLASLAAHNQMAALAQLAGSRELDDPARVAAIGAIATAPGDHLTLLGPLAGTGSAALRRAAITALSASPVDPLVAAAQAATSAPAAGDLWRAVTRRARAVASERDRALAAELAALASATDYERRYRLIDGIATLGDHAALQRLVELLHGLPAGAERAALSQVAANGLASAPRADALPLIVELARDGDAGVRFAALSAFVGDTSANEQIDDALETALASDPWPEVRRHAAEVLGDRCRRGGPARALATSVGRDPELDVRGAAMVALVQCKAPGTGELLAKVWDDGKLPVVLRQRAVELAATLGDPALGVRLVGRLSSWRGAAIESADALALAQSAAFAVGRLAPPGAGDALQAALADSAYPEIVAAAAAGLGLLGPKCPRQALSQLRALSQNQEQQIALAAKRAIAQCGR